jgi:Lar family restriction alleviation protein
MTNGEKYKTAEERTDGFRKFCRNFECCIDCPLYRPNQSYACSFAWLDLEYKAELKPCPFCGRSDIRMHKNSAEDVWYVHCHGCGCSTGGAVVKDMAIETWNRRETTNGETHDKR